MFDDSDSQKCFIFKSFCELAFSGKETLQNGKTNAPRSRIVRFDLLKISMPSVPAKDVDGLSPQNRVTQSRAMQRNTTFSSKVDFFGWRNEF
jgi:hypothetical protein